ncbi:CRISPR-associated helicase Cas3', partial [Hydrogenivirga sp.]
VRASTGYGKTEAGFIFLKDKGFFTLPIRTSANAIYERAKLMFGNDSVGLLHSTAPLYLIDNSEENRNFLSDTVVKDIFLTKNFGKPLIVSTPDQIFPFILRPRGFEKYYSLLSYARVVLDEVQLFEPHTLGFIVKAAEKINSMGGRVMIMTATLPEYVRKDLACIDLAEGVFLNSEPRHNVRLVGNSLLSEEGLNFIKELSKRGKVLVVVNTKSRAIQLGKRLESGKLLHSFFTHRDRRKKEKLIEDFFKGSDCGVWITTQIAEVSLDLDADFLVTELSTVDSLLQRMGRVNRKGEKSAEEPNVFVFTEECSGIGSVYRKSIHMFTKDSLKEGIITEKEKQELMEKVYRRVAEEDADYVRRYEEAKGYIDSLWNLEESFSKRKAQEMFRDILSVNVIPEVFKEDLESLIKTYRRETDYVEKVKAFSELTGYMFSVPSYTKVPMERVEGVKDVFWIKGNYSPELGFEPKDEDGNII